MPDVHSPVESARVRVARRTKLLPVRLELLEGDARLVREALGRTAGEEAAELRCVKARSRPPTHLVVKVDELGRDLVTLDVVRGQDLRLELAAQHASQLPCFESARSDGRATHSRGCRRPSC